MRKSTQIEIISSIKMLSQQILFVYQDNFFLFHNESSVSTYSNVFFPSPICNVVVVTSVVISSEHCINPCSLFFHWTTQQVITTFRNSSRHTWCFYKSLWILKLQICWNIMPNISQVWCSVQKICCRPSPSTNCTKKKLPSNPFSWHISLMKH